MSADTLKNEKIKLNKIIKKLEEIQVDYIHARHALGERIKELNCLYGIAKLIVLSDHSVEKVMQGTVDLIPSSWQYPKFTHALITYIDKTFTTDNFKKSKWKQSSDIFCNNNKIGMVEVYYSKKMPAIDEGPFLKEERALINGISEMLGNFAERENALYMLRKSKNLLNKTNQDLERKNIALQELVAQFEIEKKNLANKVSSNAQKLLLPLIENLSSENISKNYIKVMEDNIINLASDFGIHITNPQFSLSSREVEVCNMIKTGLTSKQIADMLSLSFKTIESYRKSIRRKLGITSQKVNLSFYLRNF